MGRSFGADDRDRKTQLLTYQQCPFLEKQTLTLLAANCVSQLKWMAGKGSGKLFDLLNVDELAIQKESRNIGYFFDSCEGGNGAAEAIFSDLIKFAAASYA